MLLLYHIGSGGGVLLRKDFEASKIEATFRGKNLLPEGANSFLEE